MTIYPNLSKGNVFIQSANNINNEIAQIYDMEGREVAKLTVSNNQINTADLKTGTYILKIENNISKHRLILFQNV